MDKTNSEYIIAHPLATPYERVIAALVDWLIIIIVSATVFGAVIGIAYLLTKDSLPIFHGQSIGKRLAKIRVVDNDTYESITNRYEKSVIRNITLLIPIFQFLDALMIFSSDRKRFGDQWARTIVIKDQ